MVCSWGMILVIQAGGDVICLKEKELTSKLELLYNKSLYLLALNLAQSQKVKQELHACHHAAWPTRLDLVYMRAFCVCSMSARCLLHFFCGCAMVQAYQVSMPHWDAWNSLL